MTNDINREETLKKLFDLGFTEAMETSLEEKTFDPTLSDQELVLLLDKINNGDELVEEEVEDAEAEAEVKETLKKKTKKEKVKDIVIKDLVIEEVTEEEVIDLKAEYKLNRNVKMNGQIFKSGIPISFDDHKFSFLNEKGFLIKK